MKRLLFLSSILSLFVFHPVNALANEVYPAGSITIHNTSGNNVTAVGTYGKFTLASNETKTVSYQALSYACSSSPTRCTTHFYVNNVHAGSAAINVQTGKLVNMNLMMKMIKVSTHKAQNIVRSIVIK